MAAAVVGAVGPVMRLWDMGGRRYQAALVTLVVLAAAVAAVLRLVRWPWSWGVVAAAAACGVAVTTPVVGRAPAIVVAATTVVAHAVLVEWRPLPTWPSRERPVALLAAPVLAVAVTTWIRTGSNALTLALLVATLAVVELHHRTPRVVDAPSRLLERGVTALAAAVANAALLVAALPTLYLAGAVGAVGRAITSRRSGGGSRWRPAPPTERGPAERRDAARPFAPTLPRDRRRRTGAGVVVLATIVVATLVVVDIRRGDPSGRVSMGNTPTSSPEEPDPFDQIDRTPYSQRPGYADMPFADELQREFLSMQLPPDPLTGYRAADHRSRLVNVEDGERRTLRPSCDCPRVRLWFVGASSAFGVAQRDEHTVASELVRLAERDGIALDVRTLAAPGWTIWQESRRFRSEVERSSPDDLPALAVFFDGFNDVLGTITQSVVAGRIEDRPAILDTDEIRESTRRQLSAATVGGGETLGREAARRYRVERDDIDGVATAAGIETEYFFQPDAFASPTQRRAVDGMYRSDPDLFERAEIDRALETASTALAPDVHDLRHALDGVDEPVFGDVVHTDETGARIVAAAMYRVLSPRLRALAAAPPARR